MEHPSSTGEGGWIFRGIAQSAVAVQVSGTSERKEMARLFPFYRQGTTAAGMRTRYAYVRPLQKDLDRSPLPTQVG